MQSSTSMKVLMRLVALVSGLILALALSRHIALADGGEPAGRVTLTAPSLPDTSNSGSGSRVSAPAGVNGSGTATQTNSVAANAGAPANAVQTNSGAGHALVSAPSNVDVLVGGTRSSSGAGQSAVSVPGDVNMAGSALQTNGDTGRGSVSAPINAAALGNGSQTNAPGPGSVSASVNAATVNTSRSAATAGSQSTTLGRVSPGGASTATSAVIPAREAASSPPVAGVQVGGSDAPPSAAAIAPMTAHAAAAPTTGSQTRVAATRVNNTAGVPADARAAACAAAGINVGGRLCGASGSATALVYAPGGLRAMAHPSTGTQARVAGNRVDNSTGAPTTASLATCPLAGVNVRGYGCGTHGSGAAVVRAPTTAGGASTPSSTTHAAIAGNNASSSASVPVTARARACPLVGIHVRGYACGGRGSGALVAYGAAGAHGTAAPVIGTQANVAGNRVANTTRAPMTAGAASCLLAGVGVHGYACHSSGSAAGVIFAPTSGRLNAAPASTTHTSVAGKSVNDASTAPIDGRFTTCPLVGIRIRGYGCGTSGTGAGVLFLPASGRVTAIPVSTIHVTDAGTGALGSVSVPAGAGVSACPLLGIDVSGYGCGAPGSATGVARAPANGHAASTPAAVAAGQSGSTDAGLASSTPTGFGLALCPVLGINVVGFGCDPSRQSTGTTAGTGRGLPGTTGATGFGFTSGTGSDSSGEASRFAAVDSAFLAGSASGPQHGTILPATRSANPSTNPAPASPAGASRAQAVGAPFPMASASSSRAAFTGSAPSVPAAASVPAVPTGSSRRTASHPAAPAADHAGRVPRHGGRRPTAPVRSNGHGPAGPAPQTPRVPGFPSSHDVSAAAPTRGASSASAHMSGALMAPHAPISVGGGMRAPTGGLSALPRTGGGASSGGRSDLPILPALCALLLIALGTLTRRFMN